MKNTITRSLICAALTLTLTSNHSVTAVKRTKNSNLYTPKKKRKLSKGEKIKQLQSMITCWEKPQEESSTLNKKPSIPATSSTIVTTFKISKSIKSPNYYIQKYKLLKELNEKPAEEVVDLILKSKTPFSLDTYNMLPKKVLDYLDQELKNQFEDNYQDSDSDSSDENKQSNNYPLYENEYFQCLLNIANTVDEKIEKLGHGSLIYSLGQTALYVTKCIEISRQLNSNSQSDDKLFHTVAFSGNFEKKEPSKIQKNAYKKYLEKIGLSPRDIITRYQEKNQKTILVEYIISGVGLKAFLAFFSEWKKSLKINDEKFKNAFHIICIHDDNLKKKMNTGLKKILSQYDHRLVNEPNGILVTVGDCDEYDERLVPHFPFTEWDKQDPLEFTLSQNAQLLLYLLVSRISKLHPSKKTN